MIAIAPPITTTAATMMITIVVVLSPGFASISEVTPLDSTLLFAEEAAEDAAEDAAVAEEVAAVEDAAAEDVADVSEDAAVEDAAVEEAAAEDAAAEDVFAVPLGAFDEQIAFPFVQVPAAISIPSSLKYIPGLTFLAATFCSTFLYLSF